MQSRTATFVPEMLALLQSYGRQNWWPASTPFEVVIGAILVQNTTWKNVELALERLRSAEVLDEMAIRELPPERLEELIRPAGFFRQKSATLNRLAFLLAQHGGLASVLRMGTQQARFLVLQVKGVGPETADSILLYAGGHEVFVVDIYLRRWLARNGRELEAKLPYETLRHLIEEQIRATEPEWLPILDDLHGGNARHAPTPMSRLSRRPVADFFAEVHAVLVSDGIANKKPGVQRRANRREQSAT